MAIDANAVWKLCKELGMGVKPPKSTTLLATVTEVELDGTVWVNLSGSSQPTPISHSMANVEPGDEVSVTISGGRATIGSRRGAGVGTIREQQRDKGEYVCKRRPHAAVRRSGRCWHADLDFKSWDIHTCD